MRFGLIDTRDANGSILAHAVKTAERSFPKGEILSKSAVDALLADGVTTLTVATLDDGHVPENEAADALAKALGTSGVQISRAATGRVNFYATKNGVFWPDKTAVDLFNGVDPGITLATLAEGRSVHSGEMVATIKIIPLAVTSRSISATLAVLGGREVFSVKEYLSHDVVLISTLLPNLKLSVVGKTTRNLLRRLESSQSRLASERVSDHNPYALAAQIQKALKMGSPRPRLIVVFGASAVTDERDVIPEAIRLAGGRVIRVGMPVDPGNLLVLGEVEGVPIIGAPGCARSPKENGFDWVLNRLLTGERPDSIHIAGMGVGGLLKEIPTRPSPRGRLGRERPPLSVAAVLLAAGTSSRMGDVGKHKLLATFDGVPLVRRSALAALQSNVARVFVVTGYRSDEIERALDGLELELVRNPFFAEGISSSLCHGLTRAIDKDPDGVLVLLADMPHVSSGDISLLISSFNDAAGTAVVRATTQGKRGNPVIIPRSLFPEVLALKGDVGARHVIENSGYDIVDVEIGAAALMDIDTPKALADAGGVFSEEA